MTSVLPENMSLEEIREQLALYNRLYYQKRRHEKEYMETKRTSALRYHRRKKMNEMIEKGELDIKQIDLKDIDYNKREDSEDDKNKVKSTKPRKYKGGILKILNAEQII